MTKTSKNFLSYSKRNFISLKHLLMLALINSGHRNLSTSLHLQAQRTVTQFHYTGWPDHGVPTTTSSLINLRKLVNQKHFDGSPDEPVIVLCR